MGTALLNFLPGGMSFDDYFGWGDLPEAEKALRFLVGLAPAGCMAAIWSIRPASIWKPSAAHPPSWAASCAPVLPPPKP
jgi:hypothetical protein